MSENTNDRYAFISLTHANAETLAAWMAARVTRNLRTTGRALYRRVSAGDIATDRTLSAVVLTLASKMPSPITAADPSWPAYITKNGAAEDDD